MIKFPRFASKQIASIYPESNLFKTRSPIFLPFYHTVSNKYLPHILNYPFRDPAQFENEIDLYLRYFKPVSLEYLIKNPKPNEKVFHLTIDDGLRECSEVIAPILLRKGIPATFFINSGFVDNKALFHRYKASLILTELSTNPNKKATLSLVQHGLSPKNILQTNISQVGILNEVADILGIDFFEFLKNQKPYLTSNQILELKRQGFSIGAHSDNHLEFWRINEEEQLKEIRKSMNWIIENFDPGIKTFSFPFTDKGVSLKMLRKLKEENICDITFGTAGLKYDECPSHLQRYPAEQFGDYRLNLKSEWVYFLLRKAVGKATVKH